MTIDPRHEVTQARLVRASKILVAVGGLLLVTAFVAYATIFLRPSSEFFADPDRVMDATSRAGFIGVVCFGLGGLMIMGGAGAFFFARAGALMRFASAESTPVARDVFNDFAKGATEGVTAIARAAKAGLDGREVVKVRCPACRHLEPESATVCSSCGKAMG